MVFCERLTQMTAKKGHRFTLPSEAQWEYACRAGSTTRYCFGDDEKELGQYAWYRENSGPEPYPVGQKKANKWGLHDMHGNVWEWCLDTWHDNYEGAPTDSSAWTDGGSYRVIRGGCWNHSAGNCRSAVRGRNAQSDRFIYLGFRVARSFEGK